MALLRKRNPYRYIPIHPDNVASRDWIILLEGGTVVGPRAERLRVAMVTQERKIVKRRARCGGGISLSSRTTIHAFTCCFSVRNYSNTIVTTSLCRWRGRR